MIQDFTVSSFLEQLSSKSPTPGGGGAAGLGGAVGTALGEMVVNLTLGKKKYAEVEEEMQSILQSLSQIREEFMRLADVFAPLAEAYALPSKTEEEKKKKTEILEDLLVSAAQVPLSVMELCLKALNHMEVLAVKGSRLAVSDVGVGVQMIRASLLGAKMNVLINTKTMVNREKARELNARAQYVSEEGILWADQIYTQVETALKTE